MHIRYYERRWEYTLDRAHGLGILFEKKKEDEFGRCFFEDGTLVDGTGRESFEGPIGQLRRYSTQSRDEKTEAKCTFTPGAERKITVTVNNGGKECHVTVERSSWYFSVRCDCGKRNCGHYRQAANALEERITRLQHAYIITDQPVTKTLFLENELSQLTRDLDTSCPDMEMMRDVHRINQLLGEARCDDYYWLYYQELLELAPGYDYNSKFFEEYFTEIQLSLFENPEYRRIVMDSGEFGEPIEYEGRQEKSNRVCLKRLQKGYQKTVKALDEKGDYTEDYYKEFLLKYRDDRAGLLRYYAEGKETLEECDFPFLEKIAEKQPLPYEQVRAVAGKLDNTESPEQASGALRKLVSGLTADQIVEVYSGLRNISLSPTEIRGLDREAQLKMIRNTPISKDSFIYIMDDLMADSAPAERGKFLLFVVEKYNLYRNREMKEALGDRAQRLPDNRLLMSYLRDKLDLEEKYAGQPGDPEREIKTYFRCGYRIVREKERVYSDFVVIDPEGEGIVLRAQEEKGVQRLMPTVNNRLGYSPELIRKVCLEGQEEKYAAELEQKQDELAADLFEKEQGKFVRGYRALCESLREEKILYRDEGKARIEWLLYREGASNALSFRVGHGRMYVVKDAMEFLGAFRKGSTAEYGKDLILTHDLNNLDPADAAVMKMLVTAKYTKGRASEPNNKRYVTVNAAVLANILDGLEGRTIYYNEVPCALRMEKKKVRLKIGSKYELGTDLDSSRQELINLQGKGYLLTKGKDGGYILDRLDGTAEEVNLTALVDQNPKVRIKPILKDFQKNIYARYFEMFDVDKAVQRDFTLSQIRLNTYFELERGTIKARTEVLRDEKVISPQTLTDRIDRVKLELLDNYLQSLGFAEGVLEDESRVLAFFKMDFTRLKSLTNVYLSENLKNKELKSIGKPVVRVTYKNNLAQVFLEKSEFTERELEQIVAGLRKKRKYILLDGNRIVDLDSEAARDFGETVRDFGMDPGNLYKKKTVSMVDAIKAFAHERSCRVDKFLRDMIEEIRNFKESEIALPNLQTELRDYQADGFRWLSILSKYGMGGILADDMGLGKTIQMIALIRSDRTHKPSLVVCPKSLVFNWVSEFTRFDGKTRVQAIYGLDRQRTETIAAIDGKEKAVYITSYDSLRNDISKYGVEFNYVVLDEAQYIKNVNAMKTKSVKELKAGHRFALTGTPIENSVVDLWSIFDFLMPGYFEELSVYKDAENAVIARKAAPFILRRVKEDVLEDLPPKYERILSADMSDGQRKLYDAMRMEARKALEEGGKAFDMLPYLTRLRQVCVDPAMFVEDYRGGSGKMEMLSTLIPEYLEGHHRILIFSQFVKALESVRQMLTDKGIDTLFLSGATPAKDRVEMMDAFNNGNGADVFLISLKAGGTGLNLTGADTVIHLDPWWNVAAENQASDRAHRIGQTRNVEVIKLIAGESIEQRVVELQDMKKEVIRQVISDDEGSVTSASLEDIAFVLE